MSQREYKGGMPEGEGESGSWRDEKMKRDKTGRKGRDGGPIRLIRLAYRLLVYRCSKLQMSQREKEETDSH